MPSNQSNLTLAQKELQTIELTKRTFRKKGFWQKSQEEQEEIMRNFLNTLKNIWEIEGTTIQVSHDPVLYQMTGGGEYNSTEDTIKLYKASLMTALHEFKHLLQFKIPSYTRSADLELDAQSWSHSIFKAALPILYKKSLESGKFFHSGVPVFSFNFLDFIDEERMLENNPTTRNTVQDTDTNIPDSIPEPEPEPEPDPRQTTKKDRDKQ